jgi:S1-C subfamily serine protease
MGQVARPVFDNQGQPLTQAITDPDQCLISDVVPNSGAQRAGIKIGDVIEKIDGQKIETFDDLKLHVAQHRAGDKLSVTVNRNGKQVKLEVQLASQKSAPRF